MVIETVDTVWAADLISHLTPAHHPREMADEKRSIPQLGRLAKLKKAAQWPRAVT